MAGIKLSDVHGSYEGAMPPVIDECVRQTITPADLLRSTALTEAFRSIRKSPRRPSNVLHALVLGGEMTVSHLAAAISLDTSHVAEEVDTLLCAGLIEATQGTETYALAGLPPNQTAESESVKQ